MFLRIKEGLINLKTVKDVFHDGCRLKIDNYNITVNIALEADTVIDKIQSALERGVFVLDIRQYEL